MIVRTIASMFLLDKGWSADGCPSGVIPEDLFCPLVFSTKHWTNASFRSKTGFKHHVCSCVSWAFLGVELPELLGPKNGPIGSLGCGWFTRDTEPKPRPETGIFTNGVVEKGVKRGQLIGTYGTAIATRSKKLGHLASLLGGGLGLSRQETTNTVCEA